MRTALLVLIIIVLPLFPTGAARSQNSINHLPSDLVFTTGETTGGTWIEPHNILARIDAETLEVVPFYTNQDAYEVIAINWSPAGDLLAIFLRFVSEKTENQTVVDQLCLLDRSGVLQVCLEDTPLIFGTLAAATFSWSADGSRFYFVADYGRRDKRLIEADATTGQTLRTVYQYSTDDSDRTQALSWTSTLDYVIINPGLFSKRGLPRLLVNLENNERLDINALMPESAQLGELCPQFSPHNTFLTATIYIQSEYDSHQALIVFDKQGRIAHIIDETSGFGVIQPLCPVVWEKNEAAFYFNAQIMSSRDFVIFRYSLDSETLEVFHNMGTDRFSKESIYGPYVLSPDETHIAGITSPQSLVPQVAVLYPTGEVEHFSEPYSFGAHPIWIPPTSGVAQ